MSPGATQGAILTHLSRGVASYLEIGVQEGHSLEVVMRAAGKHIKLLALCDDWGTRSGGTGRGSHDHIQELLEGMDARIDSLLWLDGRSQERLPELLPAYAEQFSLVHVDGEHSEEACSSDMDTGWELLAPGGFMVVHDVDMQGPRSALYGFLEEVRGLAAFSKHIGGHHTAVLRKEAAA